MKKILLLMILLIVLNPIAFAKSTTSAYLEMGGSARAAGMGKSFLALADDSSAIFYNPAGLTRINGTEVSVTTYKAYEAEYLNGQLVFPLLGFNWGIGYLGANVSDIKETSLISGSTVRRESVNGFNYQGQAFLLSIAKNIIPELSVGTTIKYTRENMIYSGSGLGVDLGILYSPWEVLSLGFNAKNIFSVAETWNTEDNTKELLPIILNGGFCISNIEKTLNFTTDVSYELKNKFSMNDLKIKSGIEYWISSFLALRVGLTPPINGSGMNQIINSAGVGVRFNNQLFLDFSWTNQDSDLDIDQIEDIYRVSLTIFFEQPKPIRNKNTFTINQPRNNENKEPIQSPESVAIANTGSKINTAETADNAIVAPLESKINVNETATYPLTFDYELIKGKPGSSYIVDIYIKDTFGKTIKHLIKEKKAFQGTYQVNWDGSDDNGKKVANGTYYIRLYATSQEEITSSTAKININTQIVKENTL